MNGARARRRRSPARPHLQAQPLGRRSHDGAARRRRDRPDAARGLPRGGGRLHGLRSHRLDVHGLRPLAARTSRACSPSRRASSGCNLDRARACASSRGDAGEPARAPRSTAPTSARPGSTTRASRRRASTQRERRGRRLHAQPLRARRPRRRAARRREPEVVRPVARRSARTPTCARRTSRRANLHRARRDGANLAGANTKDMSETDPERARAEDFRPDEEGVR